MFQEGDRGYISDYQSCRTTSRDLWAWETARAFYTYPYELYPSYY